MLLIGESVQPLRYLVIKKCSKYELLSLGRHKWRYFTELVNWSRHR